MTAGSAVFLFEHLFQPLSKLDPVLYPEQPEFPSGFSVIAGIDPFSEFVPVGFRDGDGLFATEKEGHDNAEIA